MLAYLMEIMRKEEATKKTRISNNIFCTLPLTSIILPYYGYAHESWTLMMHWRKESRMIWINNKDQWNKSLVSKI